MNRVGDRSKRSDKKVDVKPTMSLGLKDALYAFASLCNEPVKNIAERLCIDAMISRDIIEDILIWFRRDYIYRDTVVLGNLENPKLKVMFPSETGKVTIKFKQVDYDKLCELAYALDITPTSTATVLIRMATKNPIFMNLFVDRLHHVSRLKKEDIKNEFLELWHSS